MLHTPSAHKLTPFISLCLLVILALTTLPASAQSCDRDCLTDLLDQYIDALAAHDHTQLPLADDVKYTVDGQADALGEGLWQSVTGVQGFRHDYLDLRQQVAASHVVFDEAENQILLSVLLHVDDNNEISGIET